MENTCATGQIVGLEFVHIGVLHACGMDGRNIIDLTVEADEADGVELLFGTAPISEVELPADGGRQPRAPRLTVIGSDGPVDLTETAAAVRGRVERARQGLREMLRPADRAAS